MFNVRIEIDEIQFRNFVTYTFFHMLIDKPNWNACNWRVIETTSRNVSNKSWMVSRGT